MKNQNNNIIKKGNVGGQPSGLFVKAITTLALPIAFQVSAGCSSHLRNGMNRSTSKSLNYKNENRPINLRQNLSFRNFSYKNTKPCTTDPNIIGYNDFVENTKQLYFAKIEYYYKENSIEDLVGGLDFTSLYGSDVLLKIQLEPFFKKKKGDKTELLTKARGVKDDEEGNKVLLALIKEKKSNVANLLKRQKAQYPNLIAHMLIITALLEQNNKGYNVITGLSLPKHLKTANWIKMLRRPSKSIPSSMKINRGMIDILVYISTQVREDLENELKDDSKAEEITTLLITHVINKSIESSDSLLKNQIISESICQELKNMLNNYPDTN